MLEEILRGKKVLVLGGSGRVGRLLLSHLPADTRWTGTGENSQSGNYLCIRLPDQIDRLPMDVDVVIVLAAIANIRKANENPESALRLHVAATNQLISFYKSANRACHLVLTSSVRTASADSMYSWSKIGTETLCASSSGIRITVARFGSVMKGAGSIQGLLASIVGPSGTGFVTSGTEYYQASFSVPYTLGFALAPDTQSGSIVTPLLSPTPIPFVAGYLAGYERGRHKVDLTGWAPNYKIVPPLVSPIPDWWLPFTQLTKAQVDSVNLYYLVTNFKEVTQDERSAAELQERLREHESPNFGQFASYLEREDVLN